MRFRSVRFPVLAAAVALCAAGTVVAVHGGGGNALRVPAAPSNTTALTDAVSASPTEPTIVAASAALSTATPTAAPADTAQPTSTAKLAPVLVRSEPVATPTEPAPTATGALPMYTSLDVLNRSRDVLLPSGKAFADCVMIGAESGPWNFQIHDYWNLDGTWTVETHSGDVGLIFVEATQSFRVRNINRSGC